MKDFSFFCLGIISLLYLLNLGLSNIEFIPDNIPFIGSLDEAGATIVLLICMRYFGVDLTNLFNDSSNTDNVIDVE